MLVFKVKKTVFVIRHPTFFGGINVEYDEFNDFITVSYGHSLLRAQYKLDGGMKIIDMKRKLRKIDDPCFRQYYNRGKHDKFVNRVHDTEDKFISWLKRFEMTRLPDAHLAETLDEIRARKEQLEGIAFALHDLKHAKKDLVNFVDDLEKIEEG
jgi:hypothetical protein